MPKRKQTQKQRNAPPVVYVGAAGYSGQQRPKYPAPVRAKRKSNPRKATPMDSLFTPKTNRGRQASFKTVGRTNIVRHREMIGTISFATGTPSAFALPVISDLNPGLPNGIGDVDHSPFSWIQPMANLYEKYKIRRAQVVFEPTCSLSTGSGTVAMCIDYDVRDAPPIDMPQMINNVSSVYGPPWTELILPVLTQKTPLFTRSSAPTGAYDLKTYDYGTLYVATEGSATASAAAGRLFIEYEIELSLPQ
jgi:hypothetical protein